MIVLEQIMVQEHVSEGGQRESDRDLGLAQSQAIIKYHFSREICTIEHDYSPDASSVTGQSYARISLPHSPSTYH